MIHFICRFMLGCFFLSTFIFAADYEVLVDTRQSHQMGASVIGATHYYANRLDDWVLKDPLQEFLSGDELHKKGLSFMTRTGHFILLDVPISLYLMVWNHEYFGHGASIRELGGQVVDYYVSMPWPYEPDFNGYTSYYPGNWSGFEKATVAMAGMVGNEVLSESLLEQQFRSGELTIHESLLMFFVSQDFQNYVRITKHEDLKTDLYDSNGDVANYLEHVNEAYGYNSYYGNGDNNYELTLDELKNMADMNRLSPTTLLGYAVILRYVLTGDKEFAFPYWEYKSNQIFFDLRPQLTPFGTAWELSFLTKKQKSDFVSRYFVQQSTGDFSNFWMTGFTKDVLYEREGLRVGLDVAVWQQPNMDADTPLELKTGALCKVKSSFPLDIDELAVRGLVNIGFKSEGYYRFYPIAKGLFFEMGISFSFEESLKYIRGF
jgi:hypothetical protein